MIALDAKIFSEIVRKLPDSEIVITTDDNDQTLITCEKAKFQIAGKSGSDFAYLPYIEKKRVHFSFTVYTKRSDSSDNFFDCRYREQ